jgi:hypothetical protein
MVILLFKVQVVQAVPALACLCYSLRVPHHQTLVLVL